MIELKTNRIKLLNYLFNNSKKKVKKFLNNKKILFSDNFKNILYYPNERYLQKFYNKKNTKKKLFHCIIQIMKGKYKDNYNQIYRAINPALILLVYDDLIENNFEFILINSYCIKMISNDIYLRPQYYQSFKLYYFLINDEIIMELFTEELIKKLYINIYVEKYIKPTNFTLGRYIDLMFIFAENSTLSIEINEKSHNYNFDKIRERQIFAHSLNKCINFEIENGLDSVKEDIFIELSKQIYKIDKNIGINLFMIKIHNFPIKYTKIFTEINTKLENNILTLNKFIIICKENFAFDKIKKILKKMIKNDDFNTKHIVNDFNPKKMIKDNKLEIDNNIKINKNGFTKILCYPRKKDWIYCNEIYNMYSTYMSSYYKIIKTLLDYNNTDIQILHEEYNNLSNYISGQIYINELGLSLLSKACNKCSDYEHNNIIPFLIKDSTSYILCSDIKKRLKNDIVYNKFLKTIETSKRLNNYKWLSKLEMMEIYNKYLHHLDNE